MEKLTGVFRHLFRIPDLVLTREMDNTALANWDSVMQMDIVLEVEDRFSVSFTADEVDGLRSVGDFIDLLSKKR